MRGDANRGADPAAHLDGDDALCEGHGAFEDAVEGRVQSVHLEQLMEEDWGEQLIPRPRAIARRAVRRGSGCGHVVALAFEVADEIERSRACFSVGAAWRELRNRRSWCFMIPGSGGY